MQKKPKHPLDKMVESSMVQVEAYLFEGCLLGGRSLQALLDEYRTYGPYTPTRYELVRHLHRCLEGLVELDALLLARSCAFPSSKPIKVKRPRKKITRKSG